MNKKSAAIQPDQFDSVELDKLSATQFIEALQAKKAFDLVRFWPEKKKYELEIEPVLGGTQLKHFIEIINNIKNEKKKAEYELPPGLLERVEGPTPEPAKVLQLQLDKLSAQIQGLTDQVSRMK